jgi:hypothetical protein
MNRIRSEVRCDVCGEEPRQDDRGKFNCHCEGKRWERTPPVEGTDEDRAILEGYGWQLVKTDYDTYWVGPVALAILYLYDDNTWEADRGQKEFVQLGDYLKWYDEMFRAGSGAL